MLLFLQPLQHLHPVPGPDAKLHGAPFEPTAAQMDKDQLPLPRVEDGIGGDHKPHAEGDLQLDVGVHPGA